MEDQSGAEKKPNTLPELRSKLSETALKKSQDAEAEQAFLARLQKFMEIVNGEVEKEKLENHPIVANVKYLPISHMEMGLDEVFFGQWCTKEFHWQIVSNEIAGSIELSVFHPLTKQWITRTGAGAIQIMVDGIPEAQKKNMSKVQINAWALNIENKKPGALTNGGFAKFKAELFKNACLSLGRYFGRDVNREHSAEDYMGTIKDPDERKNELRAQISNLLRENQDSEYVKQIADLIVDAEDAGNNTIEFYKTIIKRLKGNADN